MSKLTREVVYLNESDRPKKVEPLSFTEWCEMKSGYSVRRDADKIQKWTDRTINEASSEYATYLQEFSAEEKAVEFTSWLNAAGCEPASFGASEYDEVYYLGKDTGQDSFLAKSKSHTDIIIYRGKLNSGRY